MEQQNTFPETLWAGTDHSLELAKEAYNRMMAGIFSNSVVAKQEEEEAPWNFTLDGSIGVIRVAGPLVNSDDRYNRYYGVTGYPDIRKALVYAATNPEVKAILLDVNSPGGAVSGVADTSDLIRQVDKLKPVYAYTEGNMLSAGYWIGASARKVYSSSTATLGSIGVIATLKEYTEAMKEAGIGVKVMRAGKYKALINPYEVPTKAALDQFQQQLDAAYTVFAEHISAARGVSIDHFEATMGQGREFFGIDAVKAGLSDGLMNYDSVISKISAKLLDKSGVTQNNLGKYTGTDMPKQALTEQQIAAIAAGATPEAAVETEITDPVVTDQAATTEMTETSAAATQVTEPEKANDGVLAFVQGQLVTAQAEVVDLKVRLQTAEALVASMKSSHDALLKIAAQSCTTMRVALNLPKVDLSAQGAEAVLADHAATSAAFQKAFKAGGVAAVNPADKKTAPAVDPNRKARLAATRI